MEESLSYLARIKNKFGYEQSDIGQLSPLSLAFVGDAVFDLIIRTALVEKANKANEALHRQTVKYVKATTQAKFADALLNIMTPEELAVYKRGRNAKVQSSAKNASIADYHKATGLEALMGYLYLRDEFDRLLELVLAATAGTGYDI